MILICISLMFSDVAIFSGTYWHVFRKMCIQISCLFLNQVGFFFDTRASWIAQLVKNLPAMQETLVQFLGQEDPLEKG